MQFLHLHRQVQEADRIGRGNEQHRTARPQQTARQRKNHERHPQGNQRGSRRSGLGNRIQDFTADQPPDFAEPQELRLRQVAGPYPRHGVLRRRKEFQGAASLPHQEEVTTQHTTSHT